jgi:hypothetical protein
VSAADGGCARSSGFAIDFHHFCDRGNSRCELSFLLWRAAPPPSLPDSSTSRLCACTHAHRPQPSSTSDALALGKRTALGELLAANRVQAGVMLAHLTPKRVVRPSGADRDAHAMKVAVTGAWSDAGTSSGSMMAITSQLCSRSANQWLANK